MTFGIFLVLMGALSVGIFGFDAVKREVTDAPCAVLEECEVQEATEELEDLVVDAEELEAKE